MRLFSLLKKPSPATVLASVALVVAATGTATAAGLHLITGKDIKPGTIELRNLSPKAIKTLTAKAKQAGYATRASYAQDAVTAAAVRDFANPSQTLTASSRQMPGSLLALGQDGHFPISALPDIAARVYNSKPELVVPQPAGGPATLVSFDSVSFDTAGMASPAHATSLRASVSGVYLITANVAWQSVAPPDASRAASIKVNGNDVAVDQRLASADTRQVVTAVYRLNAGDDVQVGVAESGASSTAITALGDYAPSLAMVLIGQG